LRNCPQLTGKLFAHVATKKIPENKPELSCN